MTWSRVDLERDAAATGFRPDALEKVLRLLELLDALPRHPYLRDRIALKGGTALNLFLFEVPRLSVDIDLNYTGSADVATCLEERPQLERAVDSVCTRIGLGVRRVPNEHAGGKWRLSYSSTTGAPGTLELDLNFLLRTPLWPALPADSKGIGTLAARGIPMLDIHELAAGKLCALFGRAASRDLFDVRHLLVAPGIDAEKLRVGFVVYGGMSRRDWRTVSLDDLPADPREVNQQLVPLLRANLAPRRADLASWTERLVSECTDLLSAVLPLRTNELEFLSRLNEHGQICPELITSEDRLREIIAGHPGLRWKALNVRRHRGIGDVLD